MNHLLLAAFADEYDACFEEQLKALNAFGIRYLEIRFVDGKNVSLLTDEEIARVKALLHQYDIRVHSIGSPIGKIALDGDLEAHFALAERVFQTANALGAGYVRMFSFYPPKGKRIADCRAEVFDALERLLTLAEAYGVTLCHENEGEIYGESPASCEELLSHFGGRLRAVFDMGNFTAGGYDPLAAYRLLLPYITYFHIKDATKDERTIVPPGCGDACIREILTAFCQCATAPTFVTLEPHLQDFAGLQDLTASKLKTPYHYATPQAAFADAVARIKEILL